MATFNYQGNYLNPYERARVTYKGTPLYNELGGDDTWAKYARNGQLNNLVAVLSDADKLGGIQNFANEYNTKYLDADVKMTAAANELYGDREKLNKYTESYYDDLAVLQNREVEMSEYEWNKKNLKEYAAGKQREFELAAAQKRKDEMNGFLKTINTIGVAGTALTDRFIGQLDNIISGIAGSFSGLSTLATSGDFSKGWNEWFDKEVINDTLGFRDYIEKWEAENTYARNVDGSLTGIGNFLYGFFGSLGQALPTIFVNLAAGGISGLGGAATQVASGMSKSANFMYWAGMAAGNYREIYKDPQYATIPTYQVILNSAGRAAAEYLVMRGMNSIFGTTSVDKLVFGYTGNTVGKSVAKRIAREFLLEGTEEALQEYSGFIVNNLMGTINENFGKMANFDFKTAISAFILGGLSAIGGAVIDLVTTKRVSTNEYVTDSNGNIQYDKNGNPIVKKFSKGSSWIINNDVDSFRRNVAKIISDKNLTNEQRMQVIGQAYVTLRTMSEYYGQIGEEQFRAAQQMLKSMQAYSIKSNFTHEKFKAIANDLLERYSSMIGKYYSVESFRNNIAEKLADAKVTNIEKVYTKEDIKSEKIEGGDKLSEEIQKIFDMTENVDRVVVTSDGETIVTDDNIMFVPVNYLNAADAATILRTEAEQKLVQGVKEGKAFQSQLKRVLETYRKVANDANATMDVAIMNLFFNDSFFRIMLGTANQDMYQFLSSLMDIEKAIVPKTVRDSIYKKRVTDARKSMQVSLINYLVNQQYARYENLSILTDKQKDFIREKRYSKDLAGRVIKGNKLTEDDWNVLNSTVNSLPVTKDVKKKILENLKSTKESIRHSAVMAIDNHYKNVFLSPYDGRTYLPNDTLPNCQWNEWAKSAGLTIDTLTAPVTDPDLQEIIAEQEGEFNAETTMAYYKKSFNNYTWGLYTFEYANRRVLIKESGPLEAEKGYINFANNRASVYRSELDRTIVTGERRKLARKLINPLLDNSLDTASKAYVTINDIIHDPSLLNENTKNEMLSKHFNPTPRDTFLYLRDKFMRDTGTVSIVLDENGQYVLVDVAPALDLLVDKSISVSSILNNRFTSISKFIKPEYLVGLLKDTKVALSDKNYYDPYDNVIYIDRNVTDSKQLRFLLLHEFQHAIQVENDFNGGFDYNFLEKSNISKTQKQRIIADIRNHRPEFFNNIEKGSYDELNRAQMFIYETSGEAQAYGLEGTELNDFYPTIIQNNSKGVFLIMPWGTKYKISGYEGTMDAYPVVDEINKLQYELVPQEDTLDWRYRYVNYNYNLPVSERFEINSEFRSKIMKTTVVQRWLGNDIATHGEKVDVKVQREQMAKLFSDSEIRELSIRKLWSNLAPTVPYETFLEMDVPFLRIQDTDKLYDSPFVSCILGDQETDETWRYNTLLNYLEENYKPGTEFYIFAGTIKPKELLGYVDDKGTEVFVKPSYLRKNALTTKGTIEDIEFKVDSKYRTYEGDTDNYTFDNDVDSYENFVAENLKTTKERTTNTKTEIMFPNGNIVYSDEYVNPSIVDKLRTTFTKNSNMSAAQRRYLEANTIVVSKNNDNYYTINITQGINEAAYEYAISKVKELSKDAVVRVITPLDTYTKDLIVDNKEGGEYYFEDGEHNNVVTTENALIELNYWYNKNKDRIYANAVKQPSAGTRYVSNKEAEGTNLEYFVRKNKPIQMDVRMQDFVKEADPAQLNKSLWKMIGGSEAGTLNVHKLYEYVRTAKVMNDYTFNLINKHFFENTAIKNFKQLVKYSEIEADKYYAVSIILKLLGKEDLSQKRISPDKFNELLKTIQSRPEWNKRYEEIYSKFENFQGYKQLEIDRNNMRLLFMKDFDGTIESAAHVAGIARWLAKTPYTEHAKYLTPGQVKETSTEAQTGEDITLGDTLKDDSAQDAFDDVLGRLSNQDKIDEIVQYRYRTEIYENPDVKNMTRSKVTQLMLNIKEQVEDMSPEQLDNMLIATRYAEVSDNDVYVEAVKNSKNIVRARKSVVANIKRIVNKSIRNNLSTNDMKRFVKANPDIFTENGEINPNLYKGKSKQELLELEDNLKSIAKEVRRGVFTNRLAKSLFNKVTKLTKQNKNIKNKYDRLKLKYEKVKDVKYATDYEFTINADRDVPSKLDEILDTSFDTFAKSEVQLEGSEEVNMVTNMEQFFQQNADNFNSMTQSDVDEIVEFYAHSEIIGANISRNDVRKYDSFEMFILSYFLQQNREGSITLSEQQIETINKLLNTMASSSATTLSNWRSAMKIANPNKQIVAALARSSDIEFKEADLDQLTSALNIEVSDDNPDNPIFGKPMTKKERLEHKRKSINAAIKNLETKALEQHAKNPDSFFDKLWKFQRLAMLSGPGTMVRNIVSNIIVDKGNKVAAAIGNFFVKKFAKKEIVQQYKIVGTKVPPEYKTFVDNMLDSTYYTRTDKNGNIVEVSFFDAISDGLNKYDVRKMTPGKSSTDIITEMIARNIIARVYGEHAFDTKSDKKFNKKVSQILNQTSQFVFKLLSDDPWIKKATKRYLQKMLVEDNVPLAQGRSPRVLKYIANAYSMAAWDYMHKTNVFNSIEGIIRRKAGDKGYFIYKQLLPFASASWNWFMEGLNYTPIGLAKGIIQMAKLENTIIDIDNRRAKGEILPDSRFATYMATRNIGKGIIGSIGLGIGLLLGFSGVAGIDEKDDKLKIRIGTNFYVDISDIFGSQGILIGMAIASPFMSNDDSSVWDRIGNSITSTITQLFNDSSFNDVYSMFEGTDSFGDWLVNQTNDMLSMYIPNAIKTFNSMLYTHQIKYSGGIMNAIERFGVQAIPGLAYALPKKYDPYTGEVKSKYKLNWLVNFLNRLGPVDIYPYDVSDVEKQAIAVGVKKGELTGRYSDIGNLSASDVAKLNKYYGELNKDSLAELMAGKKKYRVRDENGNFVELTYLNMSTEQRKSAISSIMTDNAKYAKIFIYTSNGGKYYANSNEYQILRKLGINNVYKANKKKEGFN